MRDGIGFIGPGISAVSQVVDCLSDSGQENGKQRQKS